MKFDLHVHTTYSDGLLKPQEVVDLAIKRNLQGISITDHDTVLGIEEAIDYSKKYKGFKIIPGIELGSIFNNEEVHILGYNFDYKNEKIISTTQKLVNSRLDRGIRIIEKLNSLGIHISLEDVMKHVSKNLLGRPHIARAMIDYKYVNNIGEAFDQYLNIGKPAYVERYHLSIEETIILIENLGGISVLAHPGLLKDKSIIDYCISKGISGIECIHSKHSLKEFLFYKEIANREDLIITGGSDFHGDQMILGDFYIENVL